MTEIWWQQQVTNMQSNHELLRDHDVTKCPIQN